MRAKRTVRRVILPGAWLVIGVVAAVSLATLAFGGAGQQDGDVLTPTAAGPSETVPVEVATIENTLTLDANVTLDPAVDVSAPSAGTLVHVWAPDGTRVGKGDPVYQLRVEGEDAAAPPEDGGAGDAADEETAAPAARFVNVAATADGRVSGLSSALGDPVEEGAAVARVARGTYTVGATIAPLERYRLLEPPREATVTIQGGPEPFRCRGLDVADDSTPPRAEEDAGAGSSDAPADEEVVDDAGGAGAGGASVTCAVPGSVTVFDGLTARLEIDAGSAEDVLTVPVTAVQGLIDEGAVWVVGPDGAPQRREVRIGVSDGTVVEVTEGVEAGDEVLLYVPGSAPQDGAGDVDVDAGVVF